MKNNKKCVDCKYKKACTARDWEEHTYKCLTCKYNAKLYIDSINQDELIDWPQSFLMIGWF